PALTSHSDRGDPDRQARIPLRVANFEVVSHRSTDILRGFPPSLPVAPPEYGPGGVDLSVFPTCQTASRLRRAHTHRARGVFGRNEIISDEQPVRDDLAGDRRS